MTSPTSSSCTVVLLLLLDAMNILNVITLTGDLLVANHYMQCAQVFCSAGVSFHPVFSPVKWLSLPVIGRQCLWERGQSARHSTGWHPQSQPCSCCASLKRSQSALTNLLMLFHFHQTGQEPQSCFFPHLLLPSLHTLLRACWRGFLFISKPASTLNQVTATRCLQSVKT